MVRRTSFLTVKKHGLLTTVTSRGKGMSTVCRGWKRGRTEGNVQVFRIRLPSSNQLHNAEQHPCCACQLFTLAAELRNVEPPGSDALGCAVCVLLSRET